MGKRVTLKRCRLESSLWLCGWRMRCTAVHVLPEQLPVSPPLPCMIISGATRRARFLSHKQRSLVPLTHPLGRKT